MASHLHRPEFEPKQSQDVPDLSLVSGTLPPQPEEVFFRGNPVMSREPIASGRSKYGKTELEIITLENGRHYEVVTGIPKKQRSDIAVFVGTALGTSIRGHNWNTMLNMMELGYPAVLIGPEGGHTRWPKNLDEWKRFGRNLLSINLAETAENMHEIFDVLDQDGNHAPGKAIKTSESRDSAVAMGFLARAHKFERDVIYTDAIAPCFPYAKPIKVNHEAPGRLLQIPLQVASLGKHALTMELSKTRHYLHTVNPSIHFSLHVVGTVPTLVNGKAGRLAREIPHDAKIHNTHFEDDPWTIVEGWEEIFDGYDFVVNDRQPGDHGAIVNRKTQEARKARMRGLSEELVSKNHKIDLIDWANVHMAGRLAVAA